MRNMSSKTKTVPEFLFTDHTVYPNFSSESHKVRITYEICGFIQGHSVV